MSHEFRLILALTCLSVASSSTFAPAGELFGEPPAELHGLPLLVQEDFESGADRWEPADPKCWRIEEVEDVGKVFSQFKKDGAFQPPHRSPFNVALLREAAVGDFALTARVKSTIADYGHRDACLVFGYQDSAHFYYVHFGKQTDDHANQVFIVDDAPRTKISTTTSDGTPWDDAWHQIKIVRRIDDGSIEVFFDDMDKPAMTATSDKFQTGRIGIGTFDDTSQWDDVRLFGTKEEKK